MSGTTSVPPVEFTDRGFVAPTEVDILDGVRADMNAAFGGDLNPDQRTPQGQLSTSTAAIVGDKDDEFCLMTNLMDPAYTYGRFQDGIARIYFLTRTPAEPTAVIATCTGLAGTLIPQGTLAKATDGNLYRCTSDGVIGSGGSSDLSFACTVTGPIACPAHTLTGIYQAIPGWDTIDNAASGTLGNDVESRAEFEDRRAASVAINARGILGSIQGAVLAVNNVLDAYTTENDTGSPVVKGGVTLDPHSLYVAVAGGTDDDVAHAIWTKKAPGCAYNGNTTITVYDTDPSYPPPGVPYSVTFERPASLPIYFTVQMKNNAGVPANALSLVTDAIMAAFAGVDGGQRAKIGFPIFASRYYSPVALLGSWAQILSIHVSSGNGIASLFTADIAGTTLTVSAVGSGAIGLGQPIYGTGVQPRTIVLSQSGGTPGGIGTYVVNTSQTVASGAMGSLSLLDILTTDIDEVPTLNPFYVALVLV